MKTLLSYASAIALITSTLALAESDRWYNRPNVIRAGQTLATEVEHLDESLHDVKAPTDFLQKVHHTEESVKEFVVLVTRGASYPEAVREFDHIREDIRFIESQFAKYRYLLDYTHVAREWQATRIAYRRLDHEMLRSDGMQRTNDLDTEQVLSDLH